MESFSVRNAGYEIEVFPALGLIKSANAIILKTEPGKLVWQRQMEAQIGSFYTNERSPLKCNFYEIGIINESGKHGFKIFEDGKLVSGI